MLGVCALIQTIMTPFYVYVESKQSAAFQFVPFQTREQADRFVLSVTQRCQSLRAYVVDL